MPKHRDDEQDYTDFVNNMALTLDKWRETTENREPAADFAKRIIGQARDYDRSRTK